MGDVLGVADVEEVGVRHCELFVSDPGGFRGDAVGHADGAAFAVVVAGAESAGGGGDVWGDGDAIEQAELGHIEGCIFLVGSDDTNQMVEDLGDSDGGQVGVARFQDGLHLGGGWFSLEEGEDGVGVEDGQRSAARPASS